MNDWPQVVILFILVTAMIIVVLFGGSGCPQ